MGGAGGRVITIAASNRGSHGGVVVGTNPACRQQSEQVGRARGRPHKPDRPAMPTIGNERTHLGYHRAELVLAAANTWMVDMAPRLTQYAR